MVAFVVESVDEQPRPKKAFVVESVDDRPDPTAGGSTLNFAGMDTGIPIPQGAFRALAGAGKAFADVGRAAKQIVGAGDQQEVDAAKARDEALMHTGAGLAGNLGGNVALSLLPAGAAGVALRGAAAVPALAGVMQAGEAAAAAHPLLATMLPAAASGAVMGALEPTATGESRGKNIALNAGVSAAASALPRALARVVSPQTDDAAKELIDQGVRLTPGQTLGGIFKSAEDKLESVPLLGNFIKGSRTRSIEDFNRAAFNRALAPIGEKAGRDFPVGREGVGLVEKTIGRAYDKALDSIKRVDLDAPFRAEVGQVAQMTAELGDDASKQFMAIVKNRVVDRMTPAGTMSADTMKIVESDLGRLGAQFSGSADPNMRGLGAAVREVQASLRRAVERSAGPEAADSLRAANKAWSEFVRVQDAAGRVGAAEGVFTPAQFTSAVRKADKTVRKGAFARGDAIGQDLAEAGKSILPSQIPNSGTADRLMAAGAVPGYAMLPPELLGLLGLGTAAYTPLGQRLTLAMLARRPEAARGAADLLRAGAPAAGLVAAGLGAPSLAGP